MNYKNKLILALDFGGTKHAAAIAQSGDRKWQKGRRALSPPFAGATVDREIMRSLINQLLQGEKPGPHPG